MPIELDFKFNFIGRGIKNAVIKKIKAIGGGLGCFLHVGLI